MMSFPARRHDTPTNYILLVLFTCLEAFSVGSIVTFYDSRVVLQAFIVGRVTDILKDIATRLRDDFQTTTAVFIGLSLFALQTKRDFSFLAPFLSGALMAIIFAGLIQLFLPYSSWWNLLVAIVTALVFCAYIVVDTQQIFRRMSTDEYIAGAVSLYLDILNLFLAFLRIFGAANR